MKKILFISKADVKRSIKLHGLIKHILDYKLCIKDKTDWDDADIVIVENLSGTFTIAKSMEARVEHLVEKNLGLFIARGFIRDF